MRYFIDTEFSAPGAGNPIDLISIGIVREDGRSFLGLNTRFEWESASEWLKTNVRPHVDIYSDMFITHRSADTGWGGSPQYIASAIRGFIGDDPSPEFWGYYCGFDFVVLSQLMGGFDEWPEGWPFYMHDLRQGLDERGLEWIKQPDNAPHDALADARWIRDTFLAQYLPGRPVYVGTDDSRAPAGSYISPGVTAGLNTWLNAAPFREVIQSGIMKARDVEEIWWDPLGYEIREVSIETSDQELTDLKEVQARAETRARRKCGCNDLQERLQRAEEKLHEAAAHLDRYSDENLALQDEARKLRERRRHDHELMDRAAGDLARKDEEIAQLKRQLEEARDTGPNEDSNAYADAAKFALQVGTIASVYATALQVGDLSEGLCHQLILESQRELWSRVRFRDPD